MKLVHLTDTHLTAPGRRLYGLDPARRLTQAVDDINARHPDADFVLITGDLVHWGQASAYGALRERLDRLRMPYRLLIGNHDDRAAFLACFPETPVDDAGFVQYTVDTPRGVFVILDTHVEGSHAGALCERRLGWLSRTLSAHGDQDLFLAMHHAPVATGIPGVDTLGLRDADSLWRTLEQAGARPRHLFFGHVHRPLSGSWRGLPFSSLRGTNHQNAFETQALSGGRLVMCLEPPAYAVVTVTPDSVVAHQHDYLDDSPRFDRFEQPDGPEAGG